MPRRSREVGAISQLEARRLLQDYMSVVWALAPLYPHLTADEVQAAGEDAILEAYVSLDVTRAQESTWVRRVVHWRLAELGERAPAERVAGESLPADPQLPNGMTPELALLQATAVRLLARLTPRQQMVVDGRMRGETYEEIGDSLGISAQRAHKVGSAAFELLRCLLEDEGGA